MIKTFRGTLPETDTSSQITIDNSVETIYLTGGSSDIGYKIKKLSIVPERPLVDSNEALVKLYSKIPTGGLSDVNFDDATLLAVAMYSNKDDSTYYPDDMVVIIDSERVINQDLYLCYTNPATSGRIINYMLELEEVKMSKAEQAVVNFNAVIENTA